MTHEQMMEQLRDEISGTRHMAEVTPDFVRAALIHMDAAVREVGALQVEVTEFRRGFGAISLAVAAIDGESDNTPWQDVVERIKRMGDRLSAACRLSDERWKHWESCRVSRDHDRAEYADRLTQAEARAAALEAVLREINYRWSELQMDRDSIADAMRAFHAAMDGIDAALKEPRDDA